MSDRDERLQRGDPAVGERYPAAETAAARRPTACRAPAADPATVDSPSACGALRDRPGPHGRRHQPRSSTASTRTAKRSALSRALRHHALHRRERRRRASRPQPLSRRSHLSRGRPHHPARRVAARLVARNPAGVRQRHGARRSVLGRSCVSGGCRSCSGSRRAGGRGCCPACAGGGPIAQAVVCRLSQRRLSSVCSAPALMRCGDDPRRPCAPRRRLPRQQQRLPEHLRRARPRPRPA